MNGCWYIDPWVTLGVGFVVGMLVAVVIAWLHDCE